MDTTEHDDETPAEQPRADRWELAPEPEPSTVVQDRNGMVWVRRTNGGEWYRCGSNQPWSWATVLSGAPLVRLVPAGAAMPGDAEREATVDRLIRVNDALRAELVRYRGATADRDRSTSEAQHNTITRHRMNVVSNARRVLDAVDNDPAGVLVPVGALRTAMAALDRHLTETRTD